MGLLRSIFVALCFVTTVSSTSVLAILPEQIGSTQFGTGYISAAEKYQKKVLKISQELGYSEALGEKLVQELDRLLVGVSGSEAEVLRASTMTAEERKSFFRMISVLQENDRTRMPRLFMIGTERALATDGHHKVRAMVKISQSLEAAEKLWPLEVKETFAPLGRLTPEGKLITSLSLVDPDVVTTLPKDVKAAEAMREILANGLGLWQDGKDVALAAKFSGREQSRLAPTEDLNYLAKKLGITDGPTGIQYTPVVELPDSPARTLMGRYFDTRDLKKGEVAFRDYVEFYVGDEVGRLSKLHPEKYPSLLRIQTPGQSVATQKELLESALKEIDELLVREPALKEMTLSLVSEGAEKVNARLEKLRNQTLGCPGSIPVYEALNNLFK